MPTVENQATINAPIDKAYAVAKDAERFPEFMPDVKSLEVVERDGPRVVTRWVGAIPRFNLTVKWTEEDLWDDAEHTCRFRQLEGDYDSMSGVWRLEEAAEGTLFTSVVEYEYNVPVVGALVKKVIQHLVRSNIQSALEAIKRRAEGG
jgi:uncharacterized membrane protein